MSEHRPAPDVTAAVMRRLGLAGMTARRARRRRAARAALRLALCAAAVAVTVAVVRWRASGSPQESAALTLPAALRLDLDHHGRRFDHAVETLRALAPALPPLEAVTDE